MNAALGLGEAPEDLQGTVPDARGEGRLEDVRPNMAPGESMMMVVVMIMRMLMVVRVLMVVRDPMLHWRRTQVKGFLPCQEAQRLEGATPDPLDAHRDGAETQGLDRLGDAFEWGAKIDEGGHEHVACDTGAKIEK